MEIGAYKEIKAWAAELDGVMSIEDFKVALNLNSNTTLYRKINLLIEAGELVKIKRGIYATKATKLSSISSRIFQNSYISTGTVLAKFKLIGSIPERKIQAVKIGAPRLFKSDLGSIEYLSIDPKLYFGFEKINNENWANPEKAYLDTCYYFYKGKIFSFDIDVDVDKSKLNYKLIDEYLNMYDKRFITYFKKYFYL